MTILELIVDMYKTGYNDGLQDGISYQIDMLKMREEEEQDG